MVGSVPHSLANKGDHPVVRQSRQVTCLSYGQAAPYRVNKCVNCDRLLASSREVTIDYERVAPIGQTPVPAGSTGLTRVLSGFPELLASENLGNYMDSQRWLIRGAGDRANKIAGHFLSQWQNHPVEDVHLYKDSPNLDADPSVKDRGRCYLVRRDLGRAAMATMAVRISAAGSDLFVEWRLYTIPPLGAFHLGIFLTAAATAILTGIGVGAQTGSLPAFLLTILVGVALAVGVAAGKERMLSLEEFQFQDSTNFQLTVQTALEKAMDLTAMPKALIYELPKENSIEWRLAQNGNASTRGVSSPMCSANNR